MSLLSFEASHHAQSQEQAEVYAVHFLLESPFFISHFTFLFSFQPSCPLVITAFLAISHTSTTTITAKARQVLPIMAGLEIIDAEIVPRASLEALVTDDKHQDHPKSDATTNLASLYPVYTAAERAAALRLLAPSTHDVVLGAGWTESDSDIDTARRTSTSSSSSISSPSTPPALDTAGLTDALLVRSCSQGWSLSFELTPHQPLPTPLTDDEILIRNDAVGLNPVDWKSVSFNFGIPAFPWILGRDIAGTIVQPPARNEDGWKVGDRVWTCADSREMRAGGYQRFSVHKKGTLAKIPPGISDEDAATLGTGLITATVALFAFFKLSFAEDSLAGKLEKVKIDEQRDERDWIL